MDGGGSFWELAEGGCCGPWEGRRWPSWVEQQKPLLAALTFLLFTAVHAGTATERLLLPRPPDTDLFASRRRLTQVGGEQGDSHCLMPLCWAGGLWEREAGWALVNEPLAGRWCGIHVGFEGSGHSSAFWGNGGQ